MNIKEKVKLALARLGLAGIKKNEPPMWRTNRPIRASKPATCYLILSEPIVIVSVEDAVKFNENHLSELVSESPSTHPFLLPLTIGVGVHRAEAFIVGKNMESVIRGYDVILLPGGKVIGPPQVTGWRPRTPAESWAPGFDPMQELYERKSE